MRGTTQRTGVRCQKLEIEMKHKHAAALQYLAEHGNLDGWACKTVRVRGTQDPILWIDGWSLNPDDWEVWQKPKTTRIINGVEVPAPLEVMPEDGAIVWYLVFYSEYPVLELTFASSDIHKTLFSRGLLFATKSDAESNFNAWVGGAK